jgi:hypothetical protein
VAFPATAVRLPGAPQRVSGGSAVGPAAPNNRRHDIGDITAGRLAYTAELARHHLVNALDHGLIIARNRRSVLRIGVGPLLLHGAAIRSIVGAEGGAVELRRCALDDESAGTGRPSRAVRGVQLPDRLYPLAARTRPAWWNPSQGPTKEASRVPLAIQP